MAFFKNKPGEDYGAVNRTEKQMENIRFNAATNWKWNESYMLKWLQEYTWEMLWSTSFQHERYAEFTTARHETFPYCSENDAYDQKLVCFYSMRAQVEEST